MNLFELFLIAIGLSMDAFAVAVVCGLGMRRFSLAGALVIGAYFGAMQAAMPLAGYFVGSRFADKVMAVGGWAAFAVLAFIGAKMLVEGLRETGENAPVRETSLAFAVLFPLAVADSIDALAVGVSFAFIEVDILPAALFIGVVTFALSVAAVRIGSLFGAKTGKWATIAGGAILILIGIKILLEP